MLRTNLSTRPFYNSRAVNALIGVLALIVLVVTAFNVVQATRLTLAQQTLGAHAAESEAEAERLRAQAVTIRARIDPKELSTVSAAAREANAIIDRRAFSWTELFSQVEAVLPEDVRITAMKPELGSDGSYSVSIQVEGRRVEDVDAFVEALEARSTFRNVLPVAEQTSDEGLIEGVIEGIYVPAARDAAEASPAAATPATAGADGVKAEVAAQRSRND